MRRDTKMQSWDEDEPKILLTEKDGQKPNMPYSFKA